MGEDLRREVPNLPADFPQHGLTTVTNMRLRFPDFPIPGIVQHFKKNGYIGGKTMKAIKDTGTREVNVEFTSPYKNAQGISPFPARYRVPWTGKPMAIYRNNKEFTFAKMMDR